MKIKIFSQIKELNNNLLKIKAKNQKSLIIINKNKFSKMNKIINKIKLFLCEMNKVFQKINNNKKILLIMIIINFQTLNFN